ncbi:MAG: ABC transporter permease subunit [Deltaproteobacteria bacterium]|nr:ABC transporter permease subunit [Deltaproteobacteria bacterium]
MISYLVRRVLRIPLVLIASFVPAFLLVHAAPNGPFDPRRSLPAVVEASLTSSCDIDEPLTLEMIAALVSWVRLDVDGCTGISLADAEPVLPAVVRALVPTLQLSVLAILLALVLGTLGGVAASSTSSALAERASRSALAVVAAMPAFVLAPFLVLIGSLWLPLFSPARFLTGVELLVPAGALGLAFAAAVARVARDALRAPDVVRRRTVDLARGLSHVRARARALRLALLAVLAGLGPMASAITMGAISVELVFNLEGLGPLVLRAASGRDYNLLLGGALAYAALLLSFSLVADTLYGALDPRVRGAR